MQICSQCIVFYLIHFHSKLPRLVSAMAKGLTASDVAMELREICELITMRSSAAAGRIGSVGSLEQSLIASLKKKIAMLGASMLPSDSHHIYQAIKDVTLADSLKNELIDAVDKALCSQAETHLLEADCASSSMTCQQHVPKIESYLTKSDWDSLKTVGGSFISKAQVLIDRLRLLHIHHLGEATVRQCLALLLAMNYHEAHMPTYGSIYQLVQDFKGMFAGAIKVSSPRLQHYPLNPEALPRAIMESCYAKEKPMGVTMPSLNAIGLHVPLRNTSKLLRDPNARPYQHAHQHQDPQTQQAVHGRSQLALTNHAWNVPPAIHNGAGSDVTSKSIPSSSPISHPSPSPTGEPPAFHAELDKELDSKSAAGDSQMMQDDSFESHAMSGQQSPVGQKTHQMTAEEFEQTVFKELLQAKEDAAKKRKRITCKSSAPNEEHDEEDDHHEHAPKKAHHDHAPNKKAQAKTAAHAQAKTEPQAKAKTAAQAKAKTAADANAKTAQQAKTKTAAQAKAKTAAEAKAKPVAEAKAKPAAEAKAKPDAHAKAKPAAEANAKPAAQAKAKSHANTKGIDEVTSKVWCSRAYHRMRVIAKREGDSEEKVYERARAAFKHAQTEWNIAHAVDLD